MKICRWCNEKLIFRAGKGYVHQDGSVYKTRLDYPRRGICRTCGNVIREGYCHQCEKQWDKIEVDDHCVLPVDE